ncbi:hypothetical protein [Roseomonas fluvialis]|uniref:Uncharacterized protein n=1 Tax=Roseomonas fluvialis TaxID=1750527 RepID=A0ABN6P1C7_9PROT|nr:hypothetical protein [Roseomonas fluvialis]BDG71180.1 hypothetical protein Rmf_11090 [Roseomonas fluvialis]
MGGFGSGRTAGKVTVEGCRTLKLDVNRVTRRLRGALRGADTAALPAVERAVWSWTTDGEAEPRARLLVTLTLHADHGMARLRFDMDQPSRRTGQRDQSVRLETTPCRFGGVRWWWVCPATGRRCAVLYLPNGGHLFLSLGPGAYRLGYASQNQDAMGRRHGRLRRLHRRLGGAYTHADDVLPDRPKWMRWRTYERTWAEWEAAMERHEAIWMEGAERMLGRSCDDQF